MVIWALWRVFFHFSTWDGPPSLRDAVRQLLLCGQQAGHAQQSRLLVQRRPVRQRWDGTEAESLTDRPKNQSHVFVQQSRPPRISVIDDYLHCRSCLFLRSKVSYHKVLSNAYISYCDFTLPLFTSANIDIILYFVTYPKHEQIHSSPMFFMGKAL